MSEPAINKTLLVHLTIEELSTLVENAVKSALKSGTKDDRLLSVEQVCEILTVSPGWVYHNLKRLPFTRKVGGMLRFSANGLQRYIEVSKFSVKGS